MPEITPPREALEKLVRYWSSQLGNRPMSANDDGDFIPHAKKWDQTLTAGFLTGGLLWMPRMLVVMVVTMVVVPLYLLVYGIHHVMRRR